MPWEVYRGSPRRSILVKVPTYPPDWLTRHVNGVGCVRVNGDVVFVSTALAGQLIGLKQETELKWRARFFDVDLGVIELLPLADTLWSGPVIETVTAVHATPSTPDAPKRRLAAST